MKKVYVFLTFLFLTINNAYSTGQTPDYLIEGKDTVPIFNNPLEQYLDLIGNRNIVNFKNSCVSSNCWRGYVAYWELSNDSLFLLKITSYPKGCGDYHDVNINDAFGNDRPFASWYNGTLRIPKGKLFSGSDMGYNSVYEYESRLLLEKGILKSKRYISNMEFIERMRLDNALYLQIESLKDTLLFFLKKLDWEKLNKSICDCDASYKLSYLKNGQLSKVELIKDDIDLTSFLDKIYYWSFDKKCSKKIKSKIKQLSLSYFQSHRDFQVRIGLFYSGNFRITECTHYFKRVTDKELEEYVRKHVESKY